MKTFVMPPHAILLALTLAVAPWNTSAGTITIDMAEGNAVSQLAAEGRSHVDAMRSMLATDYPGMAATANRNTISYIRREIVGATVARIEYTYEKDGKIYRVVYHARSGRSMKTIADVGLSKKEKGSGSSASDTNDTDASTGNTSIEELPGQEAKETIFYTNDAPEDIRATSLPDVEGGIEETNFGDVASHANDAELKILRRMDVDIREGAVSAGGTVDGFVSKTVCASCKAAFNELASRHDINGSIHQMIEPKTMKVGKRVVTIEPVGDEPIANSRRASIQLRSSRNAYTNEQITKENLGRTRSTLREAGAIERAETTTATAEEAEACNS